MNRIARTMAIGAVLLVGLAAGEETAVFVEEGKPLDAQQIGGPWERGDGYLSQHGYHRYLYGARAVGPGDVRVKVRMALEALEHTAASFVIDDRSHFGFDGNGNRLFAQGALFGDTRFLDEATEHITPGKPFDFEMVRRGTRATFLIDGHEVHAAKVGDGPLGLVGLRPWRATMRVYDFSATGNLTEPPAWPVKPKSYTIPVIDISTETDRHVVVARGTEEVYQGHPHTLLMPDERTLFCVWTYDHGGACGPMKRSGDGGLSWSELIDVPENWSAIRNCPTIHRLVDPGGKARLFVFAGNGDMYQSVSEDEGETWTPMATNGLKCVVAPMTVMPVEDGKKYRMWVHRGPEDRDRSPLTIWQADSPDGGLTWPSLRKVCEVPGADPCEPCVLRSPDGKQLLMLMRENRRRLNSLYVTSDDEGETWSEAKELPAALTGDRHAARYAPDGRLVVAMRDTASESPTRGHFVAWVGTYDDVVAEREGQYRVKLLHQNGRLGDCGYPGLELLPDGTLAATTYVDYEPGAEKSSVVSVRFKLEELDEKAARLPEQQAIWRRGIGAYHTYRIPALAVTTQGTLLALCEGRTHRGSDTDDIDTLLRRSTDCGKTWGPTQVVSDFGGDVAGNPTAVVDRDTGRVWLFNTWNSVKFPEGRIRAGFGEDSRRIFVTYSDDDGKTWAEHEEITQQVKKPEWSWYATGPGAGIQLTRGPHKGRLIVPCDHMTGAIGRDKYWSHVFYSDDHGKSWQLGGSAGEMNNECEAVELADGSLMLNMRNWDPSHRNRVTAVSGDGGQTWSPVRQEEALPDPHCQGSIRRYAWPEPGEKGILVFSNAASPSDRVNMTIRLSYDEGRTWPVGKTLHAGPSAYSCLATLPDGKIGCLYEGGQRHRYESLIFARLRLEQLLAEED